MKPLKLAIIGTRGIPARYGGFETFAEELSVRLSAKGHQVTVYARTPWKGSVPTDLTPFDFGPGVQVIPLRAVAHKYLETIQHTASSLWHARSAGFDAAVLCNAANSPLLPLLWGSGLPVAVNVDGIERHRSKWNAFGKLWYRLGELCSVLFARKQVADAKVIAEYYTDTYRVKPDVIAYGASANFEPAGETLARFDLSSGKYILYVTRFEPENNVLGVIQGYRKFIRNAAEPIPLVLVGDAPYSSEYKKSLTEAAAGLPIIFTGFQFGQAYRELRSHAMVGIQATEVGGTHPALLEAMAFGNPLIANRVPEHEEVLGEAGLYYQKNDFEDLGRQLHLLVSDKPLREKLSAAAKLRVGEHYTWDKVTQQYEDLFYRMIRD